MQVTIQGPNGLKVVVQPSDEGRRHDLRQLFDLGGSEDRTIWVEISDPYYFSLYESELSAHTSYLIQVSGDYSLPPEVNFICLRRPSRVRAIIQEPNGNSISLLETQFRQWRSAYDIGLTPEKRTLNIECLVNHHWLLLATFPDNRADTKRMMIDQAGKHNVPAEFKFFYFSNLESIQQGSS